jgi:putative ABC transport system permease protein
MKVKPLFRNIFRNRLNSGIIVISLVLGMACINLIALFVVKEFNADRFHTNADQIYALQADDPFSTGQKMYFIRQGAAEYMKDHFSEVEDYCRILNANAKKITANHHDFFDDSRIIAASSNFFDFFSYELVNGNPGYVLQTSQDIVISQGLAQKYFGVKNPVGDKLTLVNGNREEEMVVTGIFRKPEESTQINFDMVRLAGETDSRCYLRLSKNADPRHMEIKFTENKETIPIVHAGTPGTHYLKGLNAAYFDTTRSQTIEISRNKKDLAIALIIAFMILSVAIFNYLGLIHIRVQQKVKEHSIRRVNGGSKSNLVSGFMLESFIMVAVAFISGILLMLWMIPWFNQLTNADISLKFISQPRSISLMLIVPLIVMLITTLFVYNRIGNSLQTEALKSGRYLNYRIQFPAFNIMQLVVSVVLIIGSAVVLKQISYINNKEIGLNKNVIEVKIPPSHKQLAVVFKSELESLSCVENIAIAEASPVLEHYLLLLNYTEGGIEKQYTPSVFVGDQNYTRTLGIEIFEGDNFYEIPEANHNKCIINESLAAFFAGQDLIGKILPGSDETVVIGIAKDFHYGSLKSFVEPAYVTYGVKGFHLLVLPKAEHAGQTMVAVAEIWNKLIPDYPLTVESVADRYAWMHRENTNYVKLLGACCFISIFLSMIGLFANSYHSARRRIKEIGIRKVNGARLFDVLKLLNSSFIKWVAVAFTIAFPLAWYLMDKWLESFAYKTSLSWWIFALSGVLTLSIVLLTLSWQSWKAATRNPVEALRYE